MTAAAPRWTPARIRQATPYPKPTNALSRIEAALRAAEYGDWLLKHFAKHADVIHDGRSLNTHPSGMIETHSFDHRGDWLLVPVSPQILDALAQIGAATEDFECAADEEPDVDDEPSLGSRNTFTQVGWGTQHSDIIDAEEQHDGREPDYDGETQSWESWVPSSRPISARARRRA